MIRSKILGIIMAGGKGERLVPLTTERGKPAVPFGGKYRIVDFVLSNFVNSGIFSVYVLVQYLSQSLIDYLADFLVQPRLDAGPLHHRRAAPDADGGNVVPRHRRRRHSKPQPDSRLRPRLRGGLRRRPHLPHGHQPDAGLPRGETGARHDLRPARAPWTRPNRSASSMSPKPGA
jgi:hypothetical protein